MQPVVVVACGNLFKISHSSIDVTMMDIYSFPEIFYFSNCQETV